MLDQLAATRPQDDRKTDEPDRTQRRTAGGAAVDPSAVRAAAARGLTGGSGPLPYADSIQRAFGRHDISRVVAHTGAAADESTRAMGAEAFASGDHVVLGRGTDLFTVAHEAAHVVQQRGGVHLADGVGGADDEHERHADEVAARVVRGESAEALLDRYGGGGGAPGIQRKPTAMTLVGEIATSDMTRDVLWRLFDESKLKGARDIIEAVERLVLGGGDWLVVNYAPQVVGWIASKGLDFGIGAYTGCIKPIIDTLNLVVRAADQIPPTIRTLVCYGTGRALVTALTWAGMTAAKADDWANSLFVGLDVTGTLKAALDTLRDLTTHPVSAIYKLAWSAWLGPKVGSEASTPGGAVADHLLGRVEKAAEESRDDGVPQPAKELVKANLKYLWFEIDEPQIARFAKQETDKKTDAVTERPSGGLELPFNIGMDLFGVKLASPGQQKIQLPWSGGFNVDLKDIAITASLDRLKPVFSVDKILLRKLRVGNQGLSELAIDLVGLSFANGKAKIDASAEKNAGGLEFKGGMKLQVWDTLINGTGALSLDSDGRFKSAKLGIDVLDRFTIIPGLLELANPGFEGSIASDGTIVLDLHGDVHAQLEILKALVKLDVVRASVAWRNSQFEAGASSLALLIGKHVELSATNAKVDRERMVAETAALVYRFSPTDEAECEKDISTIGNIDSRLLSFTGLKSLVVGGVVKGLRIGKRIEVQATEAAIPRPETEARPTPSSEPVKQSAPLLDTKYVGIDSVQPKLSKVGATLFGVDAELDVDNRSGSIKGPLTFAPPLPALRLDAPIPAAPGVHVTLGLTPGIALSANVAASGRLSEAADETHELALKGEVTGKADLSLEADAGVGVGIASVASLIASVFGKVTASAELGASIGGTVVIDRKSRTVRPSTESGKAPEIAFHAGAELKASIGVKLSAVLVMHEKKLWSHTFKDWTLGKYNVAGAVSTHDGAPKLGDVKGGFEGGLRPLPAEDQALDGLEAELSKPQAIYGSAEARRELIKKLGLEADASTGRRLQVLSERQAEMRAEYLEWRKQHWSLGTLDDSQMDESIRREAALEQNELALGAARDKYRLVSLALVAPETAADDVLEKGAIDIASIEQRIRDAADAADGAAAQLDGKKT